MVDMQNVRRVIGESNPQQWKYFEGISPQVSTVSNDTICYVYNEDVNIRLERGTKLVEDFDEPWVPGAGGRTDSYEWWLTYQNSPVEQFVVVSVDGSRANIPIPQNGQTSGSTPTLTDRKANLGRIFDEHSLNTFDDYANRAGIQIG